MYTITEHANDNSSQFDAFKQEAWPAADREHYGESLPDFSRHTFTLTAEEDGAILGYITVQTDAGVARLDSLIVKPDRQGEGIGTALVQAAEGKARSLNAHRMYLETGVDWDAKQLYTKLGYTVRTTLPNWFAKHDFILMDKELQ